MLVPIAFAILGGIICGIIGFCDFDDIIDAVVGFFGGAIICGFIGLFVGMFISIGFWNNADNYRVEVNTYQLEEYNIGGENDHYYVFINNADGNLQTNVQYFDKDGSPEVLHISTNSEYIYNKNRIPSVKVTEYIPVETSGWIYKSLSCPKETEYIIVIPEDTAVYHNLE